MKRVITIIFCCFFAFLSFGQDSLKAEIDLDLNPLAKKSKPESSFQNFTHKKSNKIVLTSRLDRFENSNSNKTKSVIKQRSIFDVQSLPIFCKIEHKLAKSSKMNVMMRLGSLDYVNKLEGKTP